MNVNSIGAMNTAKSASFGNKDKTNKCPSCEPKSSPSHSMVTVPRVVYAALLAAALGGPLTSCQKDEDLSTPQNSRTVDANDDKSVDSAYFATDSDLKGTPTVRTMLSDMLTGTLGLESKKPVNTSVHQLSLKSAPIQTGDIMEMKFFDVWAQSENTLTYNEQKSSEDTLVYDEATYTAYDGYTTHPRYSISKSGEALLVKKEVEGNNGYILNETFELKANDDKSVTHTEIMPDGSKVLGYTYKPKTSTSITRINESGGFTTTLDNIAIIKK
jgi:hypothetical protein